MNTFTPEEIAQLPRISFSRLQSFDRCALQHHLSWTEHWRPIERPDYFTIGGLIHKALAIWYSTKDWSAVQAFCIDLLEKAKPEHTKIVTQLMERYVSDFSLYEDNEWKVRAVEQKLEIPMQSPDSGRWFLLVAVIDLVMEDIRKKLWLFEHKSVGNAGGFWTPEQVQSDIQTTIYQAAIRMLGYDIWGVVINQLNRYPYKEYYKHTPEELFKRESTYHTETEIEMLLNEFYVAVDELLVDSEKTFHRRSITRECPKCAFFQPCIFGLKGFSFIDILNENYEQLSEKVELDIDQDVVVQ